MGNPTTPTKTFAGKRMSRGGTPTVTTGKGPAKTTVKKYASNGSLKQRARSSGRKG